MFGAERLIAAGDKAAPAADIKWYHCPSEEVIETSVIATLATRSIDRKQRVGLHALTERAFASD